MRWVAYASVHYIGPQSLRRANGLIGSTRFVPWGQFVGTNLALGGKDPAYVRPDAQLDATLENLVDGAYFNAGQSCCAVERIYVHREIYDRFIDGFVALARVYRLDNPLDPQTTLGPMVRSSSAEFVRS